MIESLNTDMLLVNMDDPDQYHWYFTTDWNDGTRFSGFGSLRDISTPFLCGSSSVYCVLIGKNDKWLNYGGVFSESSRGLEVCMYALFVISKSELQIEADEFEKFTAALEDSDIERFYDEYPRNVAFARRATLSDSSRFIGLGFSFEEK